MTELLKQSSFRVNAHEKRVNDECKQLLVDIRRIGNEGAPSVSFGELFDDAQVEQYYEALVGTLKCAKKRGLIHYKGQMLLKGMHDKVLITILDGTGPPRAVEEPTPTSLTTPTPTTSFKNKPRAFTFSPQTLADRRVSAPQRFNNSSIGSAKTRNKTTQKINERRSLSARHLKKQTSPIKTKKKKDIVGTLSDSEGWEDGEEFPKLPVSTIFTSSDTEADWTVRKSPRRTLLPSSVKKNREGRPPAPWRLRKAQSMAAVIPTRRPLAVKRWSGQRAMLEEAAKEAAAATAVVATEKEQQEKEEENAREDQIKLQAPPKTFIPKAIDTKVKENTAMPLSPPLRAQTMKDYSSEAASRINDEVVQLLADIRRVGGGESVTFGNLFDDDIVQNTYEALVGTLRSAKKRGLIDYKGQMLLKGMHDKVVISIKQEGG